MYALLSSYHVSCVCVCLCVPPCRWFLLVFDPLTQGTRLTRAFQRSAAADGSGVAVGATASAGATASPPPQVIRCPQCGVPAKRQISRSESNPNRPYYSCPKDRDHFFVWEDRTVNANAGKVCPGGSGGGTWESMVKRGVGTLARKPEYSILYVLPQVLAPADLAGTPAADKSYESGPYGAVDSQRVHVGLGRRT
jgi:hypothetical protein